MVDADRRSDRSLTTLDKGLTILEAIATTETPQGVTLTELARRLGMHRTTLLRFLSTLRARGYLDRDPETDRYRLGVQVMTLASSWLNDSDIRHVARPVLQALCDRTQELVHLTVLDHGDVVTIDRIQGKHPLTLNTGIGNRRPASCTAAGKAILAFLSTSDADRAPAVGMGPAMPDAITSQEVLDQQLADTRRRGYATDFEEHFAGVCCVAAPIRDFSGCVVASVSIAAPTQRMPLTQVAQLGEDVRAAASEISRRLGGAMAPEREVVGAPAGR